MRWGSLAVARDSMDRPFVSQGLVSRFAKLTFILPIKCFNTVKFTVIQKRLLGVMSSKLMTFTHFLLTLKKKKRSIWYNPWKYSRRVSRVNIFRSTDDLYWREISSCFYFIAFSLFEEKSRSWSLWIFRIALPVLIVPVLGSQCIYLYGSWPS